MTSPRITSTTPTNFASFPAMNTITPRIMRMMGFKLTSSEKTGFDASGLRWLDKALTTINGAILGIVRFRGNFVRPS